MPRWNADNENVEISCPAKPPSSSISTGAFEAAFYLVKRSALPGVADTIDSNCNGSRDTVGTL
jgi:hypothetical protein